MRLSECSALVLVWSRVRGPEIKARAAQKAHLRGAGHRSAASVSRTSSRGSESHRAAAKVWRERQVPLALKMPPFKGIKTVRRITVETRSRTAIPGAHLSCIRRNPRERTTGAGLAMRPKAGQTPSDQNIRAQCAFETADTTRLTCSPKPIGQTGKQQVLASALDNDTPKFVRG